MRAEEWGAELPALIQQVKASGAFDDAANTKQLEKASKLVEQGKQLDADQACNLFSKLAELQGNKPAQDTTVTLLPTAADPQAISAQTCTDGRFASVLVIKPGITGSAEGDRHGQRRARAGRLDLVTPPGVPLTGLGTSA